ncbi:hypothetical protein BV25DRAFT_712752 [Artomyces pyxidatus]|uniref:Uncharacterized protein n=1 Tax=Artomyces pyxidatus TaxID=48021 RepID=A0ACB8T073_9AGAM|nr:hypothetical protein BV25DRAFT_712752 [Artomyces pyxidatus]
MAMNILLSSIYPVSVVLPKTLEALISSLTAAEKYKINSALAHIRALSEPGLGTEPILNPETSFRGYCLAWQRGLEKEVTAAARLTLQRPMTMESLGEELRLFTGPALWKLLQYRRICLKAVKSNQKWITQQVYKLWEGNSNLRCRQHLAECGPRWFEEFLSRGTENGIQALDHTLFHRAMAQHIEAGRQNGAECEFCTTMSSSQVHSILRTLDKSITSALRKDLGLFYFVTSPLQNRIPFGGRKDPVTTEFGAPFKNDDADVILRSSDYKTFRVHKAFLAISSPFFFTMFSIPQPTECAGSAAPQTGSQIDELPVVFMSENSTTLNTILTMIYPHVPIVLPPSFWEAAPVLKALQKYEMDNLITLARTLLQAPDSSVDSIAAIRTFAVASELGFEREALWAARCTLRYPMTFELYGESIRYCMGSALYDLLQYRARCRTAVQACIQAAAAGSAKSIQFRSIPSWLVDHLRTIIEKINSGTTPPSAETAVLWTSFRSLIKSHCQGTRGCDACMALYFQGGDSFCDELQNETRAAIKEIPLKIA